MPAPTTATFIACPPCPGHPAGDSLRPRDRIAGKEDHAERLLVLVTRAGPAESNPVLLRKRADPGPRTLGCACVRPRRARSGPGRWRSHARSPRAAYRFRGTRSASRARATRARKRSGRARAALPEGTRAGRRARGLAPSRARGPSIRPRMRLDAKCSSPTDASPRATGRRARADRGGARRRAACRRSPPRARGR